MDMSNLANVVTAVSTLVLAVITALYVWLAWKLVRAQQEARAPMLVLRVEPCSSGKRKQGLRVTYNCMPLHGRIQRKTSG